MQPPSKPENNSRRDYLLAAGFFLLALFLSVPWRSRLAYHWDSAQFALAVRDYNVALHQPHPPGYFLYVMLGRAVDRVVGDPHTSLVWVSLVFGSAVAAMLYLLGTALFGRRIGVLAALFAATCPTLWFHSCVALMYVVDGFLVCLVVFWCWRAIERGGTWSDVVILAMLMAIVGGVRQQTLPGLVPLAAFTFWKLRRPRLRKLLVAVVLGVMASLAWFVPMVKMSGGLSCYLQSLGRMGRMVQTATWVGGGWDAFLQNVAMQAAYCWDGLLLGVAVLGVGLTYRAVKLDQVQKKAWRQKYGRAATVLVVWIVPMMLLFTAVLSIAQPGQVLSYLPGLWLVVAVLVGSVQGHARRIALELAICSVNAVVFLAWPTAWDGLFFNARLTAPQIREHDRILARTIQTIRIHCRPGETVVCHAMAAHYLYGLRLFQLHLPEFDHYQLQRDPTLVTPPGRPLLAARQGQTVFVDHIDLNGKGTVLLVVPPRLTVSIFEKYFSLTEAVEVPDSDGRLYSLPASQVQPWPRARELP